jgi:hypothetical protein
MSTFLSVPFDDKDEAKQMGARWDPDRRLWYAMAGRPTHDALAAKWPLAADTVIDVGADAGVPPVKTYLRVPFDEKDAAKRAGARWDPAQKMWFAVDGTPNHDALVETWPLQNDQV